MTKPVIGITLDAEDSGEYSDFPYFALRKNYSESITEAGGIPIMLPHDVTAIDAYLERIDGLLIPGGYFDIHPRYYGIDEVHDTVDLKESRTEFEWEITTKAYDKEIPILGICAGQQLLNVILGGSLIQHIPDTIENALEHEVKDRLSPAHTIEIVKGTLLHQILGVDRLGVNSSHHQAADKVPDRLQTCAIAPDGVIEAIESKDHPFCIGVEWHPEYRMQAVEKKLFKVFIEAGKSYHSSP